MVKRPAKRAAKAAKAPAVRYRVALHGFSEFERNALAFCLKHAAAREPAYVQVDRLADSDFIVADASQEVLATSTTRGPRMRDTLFVGPHAPLGARSHVERPIDPEGILRALDDMAAARDAPADSQPEPQREKPDIVLPMPARDSDFPVLGTFDIVETTPAAFHPEPILINLADLEPIARRPRRPAVAPDVAAEAAVRSASDTTSKATAKVTPIAAPPESTPRAVPKIAPKGATEATTDAANDAANDATNEAAAKATPAATPGSQGKAAAQAPTAPGRAARAAPAGAALPELREVIAPPAPAPPGAKVDPLRPTARDAGASRAPAAAARKSDAVIEIAAAPARAAAPMPAPAIAPAAPAAAASAKHAMTSAERAQAKAEARRRSRRARLVQAGRAGAESLRDVLLLGPERAHAELAAQLRAFGFQVHAVHYSADALALIAEMPLAAAFLDVAPGSEEDMDGLELCMEIKHRRLSLAGAVPPVFLLAERDSAAGRVRAKLAGSDALLIRPVSRGDAARALEACDVVLPADERHIER